MTIMLLSLIVVLIVFGGLGLLFWGGVLFGRRRSHPKEHSAAHLFSQHYFLGLNYLLNEQPDQAIEFFLKTLECDESVIETHFMLGSLFRRRGELDRAIRIHHSLIGRPHLTKEHWRLAVLELARDYLAAGMLDRAEGLLLEAINQNDSNEQSFLYLLQIYQQRKDWIRAIHVAVQCQRSTHQNLSVLIGQFYCELAESAQQQNDSKMAQMYLKRALVVNKQCARASLLLGDLAQYAGQYHEAITYYRQVEQQGVEHWHQALKSLFNCYSTLGQMNCWFDYLYKKISERLVFAKSVIYADWDFLMFGLGSDSNQQRKIIDLLIDRIQSEPSLHGLYQLINLSILNTDQEITVDLQRCSCLLEKLVKEKYIYRCHKCGFSVRKMQWLCVSCKSWETVKPIFFIAGGLS